MKKIVALSLSLLLVACSEPSINKHDLPELTDGHRGASFRGFSFPRPNVVEFPERSFDVANLAGPMVLPMGKVCENVEVVLKALQVDHSCQAEGQFAFFSNGERGPAVLATLVQALRSAGYTVDLSSGVFVSGGGKPAAGVAGASSAASSEEFTPAGTGVVLFDETAFQANPTTARAVAANGFVMRQFEADASTVTAVNSMAAENGMNVSAFSSGNKVAVFGTRADVDLIVAGFGYGDGTIVSEVPALSADTVSAIEKAYPNLTVAYDPDGSRLFVRGDPIALQQASGTLRSYVREPAQVRAEVIFAAYRSRDGFAVSSGLSPRSGIGGLNGGTITVPIDADLSAVLSAIQTRGKVSILSQPVMTAREGTEAEFVSATQVPVPRTITADGVVTTDYQYLDAGTIMTITPRLTASGLIQLDIELEMSSVSATVPPTFDRRRISTAITVAAGQTVALAGLATLEDRADSTGFPILRALGGSSSQNSSRDELVIFVRPTLHSVVGQSLRAHSF